MSFIIHASRSVRASSSPSRRSLLVVRRGFGLVGEGGSSSADFGEDFFGWFLPDERFGIVVPVLDPGLEGGDELVAAIEGSAAEPPLGQQLEPALDQVQPRAARRREVQMPAGP